MMQKLFPAKFAAVALLVAMALLQVFHILTLLGLMPQTTVWSGIVIQDKNNFYLLEGTAIALSLAFSVVVVARAGWWRSGRVGVVAIVGMWLVFGGFVLIALGNVVLGVTLENWFSAPLAVVLALIALRLALEP
jgi:archaellum biogenesis protein FlaJ (TadC family)